MNIGLIIYGSLDTVSGGYLYDRKLVQYLRACGDDVEILSLPWRNYAEHVLDNGRTLPFGDPIRFDILLQDELNHPSLLHWNRNQRGRVPIIGIVHHLRADERHPWLLRAPYRWIERAYLKGVDGFVFNSATTRAAVQTLAPHDLPHVIANPAGDRFADSPPVDAAARAHLAGPLRIIAIGNITPRKNIGLLLRALAQSPAAVLTVVGSQHVDATHARRLRELADNLGVASRVTWAGALPDAALAQALDSHHMLVGVSEYEGFGIVYLEAMQFGLPVVASTTGAAHELVTDGLNGYLVQPHDAAGLAAHIGRLATDRSLLARMSLAARARYAVAPTWEQSCALIRQFLVRECVANK